MKEVVIVAAVRTPIGSFGGSLATVSATKFSLKALESEESEYANDFSHVQEHLKNWEKMYLKLIKSAGKRNLVIQNMAFYI